MSTFAIGDIHGCPNTLVALLDRLNFSKQDRLFLMGDYIDRGPDSKGVIDFIWQLQQEGFLVHCLMGNHEELLCREKKPRGQIEMYHRETLDSFGAEKVEDIPQAYLDWMRQLPYYFEWKKFILVHAGLNFAFPDMQPFEEKREMLWIRYWYERINRAWLGERIIIHGHTPVVDSEIIHLQSRLFTNQYLNIDNGCCYDVPGMGKLCAYHVEANEIIFQQNIDMPMKIHGS